VGNYQVIHNWGGPACTESWRGNWLLFVGGQRVEWPVKCRRDFRGEYISGRPLERPNVPPAAVLAENWQSFCKMLVRKPTFAVLFEVNPTWFLMGTTGAIYTCWNHMTCQQLLALLKVTGVANSCWQPYPTHDLLPLHDKSYVTRVHDSFPIWVSFAGMTEHQNWFVLIGKADGKRFFY